MATRRERVVLELDDQFTTGMARAAAAAALLSKELNALDGSGRKSKQSMSSASAETEKVGRSSRKSAGDVDALGSSMRKNGADIDKFSGRLRLFADAAAVLGPGLVPLGAVAIPAVAGLASQLGFAAIAGGVAVAAFQGVGDALTAVNKAALEPTEANLEKAGEAMQNISPAARDFVGELREMIPALKNLRDIGAENMFPGLTRGLDGLEGALPRIENIMAAVSQELGNIGGNVGESLGSERWAPFLDFLATEAPPALRDMASAVGNVGHAMAELWMAFDPLNDQFGNWLVESTAGLDRWAAGLSKTQGFQEFVSYIQTSGPQVADTMAALGNAMVQIVQAAAPLGGPVLAGIEGIAKALGAVADSDIGTPIMTGLAALALFNRAQKTTQALTATTWGGKAKANVLGLSTALNSTTKMNQRASMSVAAYAAAEQKRSAAIRSGAATVGKAGAAMAGLAVISSGAADGIGLTNTASLALMGTMGGVPGIIGGAVVGAMLDMRAAAAQAGDAMENLNASVAAADFSNIAAQIGAAKKQLNDLKDLGGIGDIFETIVQDVGFTFSGKTRAGEIEAYEKSIRNAQRLADLQKGSNGREQAAQAMLAASRLEASGFALTAAGAKSASMSVKEFAASIAGATNAMTRQGTLDAYKTSLLDMRDALAANGKTLDSNTRAGLANRAGMRQMASSALEYAGNMKNAEKRTQFMDKARGDFIGMARALGASGPAARRMADNFGLVDQGAKAVAVSARRAVGSLKDIPQNVRTKISEVGGAKARGMIVDLAQKYNLTPKSVSTLIRESGGRPTKAMVDRIIAAARVLDRTNPSSNITAKDNASGVINGVRQGLQNLNGTSATTYVYTRHVRVGAPAGTSTNPSHNAMGNIYPEVRHYARGDVANRHMPELAGPGPTRIWREPETKGEAYIPLANDDRRPRARAIASETVRLLGGSASFATGGFDSRGIGGEGGFSGGVSVAPVVNVSMRGARVLIDAGQLGTIVGEVVDDAIASDAEMTGMRERTLAKHG